MFDTLVDCTSAFERVASRQPGHVAVIDDDKAMTFGELRADVVARASALQAAGILPGYRVAVIAESSADFLATALAVWRAGGVLVTIYPSSGRDDLQYAVRSSEPALVVVSSGVDRQAIEAAAAGAPVEPIEDLRPTTVRRNTTPNPEGLREPLSLICFSSGTTSRPKAIMLSARAVVNYAVTYGEVWHLSPDDRGIVCLPMAWMYGLAGTSLALLLSGASVVIVRRARPELLVRAIEEHSATFLAGVTTTFTKLVQYAESHQLNSDAFSPLRLCISGGEPRNEAAFDRWAQLSGVSVLDAYCSSECLPLVTYDPHVDPVPKAGSAGKVVPRSRLKVVDADGQDVAVGEVGEALSAGPGLMLGYWRDEELTREVLTADGWYRTKDLVRVDEDGYVYVVGRLSDLIIRGGVNISPAEVERVIRTYEPVADVAVVGLPDEVYGQRVVAAVVPKSPIDVAELEAFVKANLTSYKVPSQYVVVDDLPVNSTTGKVDKRELATALVESTRATRA